MARLHTQGWRLLSFRVPLCAVIAGACCLLLVSWRLPWGGTSSTHCIPHESNDIAVYDKLHAQWRSPQTRGRETLFASRWLKLEAHTIATKSGKLIDDWLWVTIRDQVNVLVHMAASQKFRVFRQKKYGYLGNSLAVVGGQVEYHEKHLKAAQRELMEEMGLYTTEWVELGKYRNDVNRGFGWCAMYLAYNCKVPTKSQRLEVLGEETDVEEPDLEELNVVELTAPELLRAVTSRQFKETKWTTTVALSLLSGKIPGVKVTA